MNKYIACFCATVLSVFMAAQAMAYRIAYEVQISYDNELEEGGPQALETVVVDILDKTMNFGTIQSGEAFAGEPGIPFHRGQSVNLTANLQVKDQTCPLSFSFRKPRDEIQMDVCGYALDVFYDYRGRTFHIQIKAVGHAD